MVVELAKPYDEEEVKRMLQRANYQPNPQPVQQQKDPLIEVAQAAGADVAGKVGMKGANMAMGKLGSMFAPKAAAYNAKMLSAANPIAAAMKGPGIAKAAGAGAGFAPMMAAAAPWLMGAAVLGKVFKLFNTGGFVGPLGNVSKVKYKTHGGDVTNEYEINMGPLSKGE
jgi:hypothetical protein|tara:strand:+ start:721 stop:1227 length:507 start_codon:yes stop_codon:yes gene_type:complete